ncbi:hypothetical protein [Streptococcus halichoeri]|uniref:hypothetical protein n=1 Tax=Streptococcus halichoeri TaxID=254785 RepID=UPI001C8E3C95|nr:hypothetical protein [Streptococcus halichoeri]
MRTTTFFQITTNKILRVSKGDIRKKDIFALVLLGQIIVVASTIFTTIYKLFLPLIYIIGPYIMAVAQNLNELIDKFIEGTFPNIFYFPNEEIINYGFKLSHSYAIDGFIPALLKGGIVLIILYLTIQVLKKETLLNEILKGLAFSISSLILYSDIKIIFLILLILFLVSIPRIGTGDIYLFVVNILLFFKPLFVGKLKAVKEVRSSSILLMLFAIIFIAKILSVLLSLPIGIATILTTIITVRIGQQNFSTNKTREIIAKILVYLVAFVISLVNSNLSNDFSSIFSISITIYFAIDRFFSVYSEIKEYVKKEYVEYYLYLGDNKDIMKERYFTNEQMLAMFEDYSDEEVLIQLTIRNFYKMNAEFGELLKKFNARESSASYRILTLSMEYNLKGDDIINFVDTNVKNKILYDEQNIIPVNFLIDYDLELFRSGKVDEAKQYLGFSMYDKGYDSIKEYYQLLDVLNDEAEKNTLNLVLLFKIT